MTWRDASGERQRGQVLSHSPPSRDENGTERPEEVLVMRDGSAHISAVPPQHLDLMDP